MTEVVHMQDRNSLKFDILRLLAVASATGENLQGTAQAALTAAAEYVGLTAAAL